MARPADRRRALILLLAGLLIAATPAGAGPQSSAADESGPATPDGPGAYESLAAIRTAYHALDYYRDHGSLERVIRSGAGRRSERFYFSTAFARDGASEALVFRAVPAEDPSQERVVWLENGEARAFDRGLDQVKPLDSLVSELAHGFGQGGLDALVVPAILAGSEAGLEDPEAASFEGLEPCHREEASEPCQVFFLSRLAGELEIRLWVAPGDHLLRRVEVRSEPFDPDRPKIFWRIDHHLEKLGEIERADASPADLGFAPPASARQVEDWERDATAETELPLSEHTFVDEITVEIFTLPLRIVDRSGKPIPGLVPDDLAVSIGGEPIPVSALDWISTEPLGPAGEPGAATPQRPARTMELLPERPPGNLKILFVQTDFEPTRIRGHLKILPLIEELVEAFHPEDRVAVLTYDSHLKLWLDFTRDRQEVHDILFDAIKPGGVPLPRRPRRGPSLLAHFDVAAARRIAEPEKALRMTGEALAHLQGEKEMIFVGWGLGLYRGGAVHMTPDFGDAVAALAKAQVTVFVLDVSQADWHALEAGLRNVAAATGGTYQSTFHFASQATHRLARTLRGHYLLTLDRGAHPGLEGPLRIRLPGRDVQVLYRPVVLR